MVGVSVNDYCCDCDGLLGKSVPVSPLLFLLRRGTGGRLNLEEPTDDSSSLADCGAIVGLSACSS